MNLIEEFQFDDLETAEHTKCKPLSIIMAVEKGSRKILSFRAASMGAKGRLAKIALKKYGIRKDDRSEKREELFLEIKEKISPFALIESDANPYYPNSVKRHFPLATHQTTLGGRSAVTGQGELKKLNFDPLFSLNHTFAMLRANINRLFRKTWCTTKDPRRLEDHLNLYIHYHNHRLLKKKSA